MSRDAQGNLVTTAATAQGRIEDSQSTSREDIVNSNSHSDGDSEGPESGQSIDACCVPLFTLGRSKLAYFQQTGQINVLEEAIAYMRQCVNLISSDDPHLNLLYIFLGYMTYERWHIIKRIDDLDQTIKYIRQVLEGYSPPHPVHHIIESYFLAYVLRLRYQTYAIKHDLEEAILYGGQAVHLLTVARNFQPLSSLWNAVFAQFHSPPLNIEAIEEVMMYQCRVAKLLPFDFRGHSISLDNLTNTILNFLGELSRFRDIESAITSFDQALDKQPPGDPDRISSLGNLASATFTRFNSLGQIADLEKAITYQTRTLDLLHSNDQSRAIILDQLGQMMMSRYERLRHFEDLQQSISRFRQVLDLRPLGDPNRDAALNNLGLTIMAEPRDSTLVDEAIDYFREAVDLQPLGHPYRASTLRNLATTIFRRSTSFALTWQSQIDDLKEAIAYQRQVIDLLSCQGCGPEPAFIDDLGKMMVARFQQLGLSEDIEEAIVGFQQALSMRPPGHPDHSLSLNNLGGAKFARFKQRGHIEDLEQAIELYHRAIADFRSSGNLHDRLSVFHNDLSLAMTARFKQLRRLEDLYHAIINRCRVNILHDQYHGERQCDHSVSLRKLAVVLFSSFNHSQVPNGQKGNLEDTIWSYCHAIVFQPPPSHCSISLNFRISLGPMMHQRQAFSIPPPDDHLSRSSQLSRIEDIEEALAHQRHVLTRSDYSSRASSCHSLGFLMVARFSQLSRVEDLDEAIEYYNQALGTPLSDDQPQYLYHNNLASALSSRFDHIGHIEDLEKAIYHCREALRFLTVHHQNRALCINNLGLMMCTRFSELGRIEDLEEAIAHHLQAHNFQTSSHLDRSVFLRSLAAALFTRFQKLRQLCDLEKAITYLKEALQLQASDHPDRSLSLHNLGLAMATRFKEIGQLEDLNEAITQYFQAIDLQYPSHATHSLCLDDAGLVRRTAFPLLHPKKYNIPPPGPPYRSLALHNLANALLARFNQLDHVEDLDQSILYYRQCLDIDGQGHPNYSWHLTDIATAIHSRFQRLHLDKDKEFLFSLLSSATLEPTARPQDALIAAQYWVQFAREYRDPSLNFAYGYALEQLKRCFNIFPTLELQHKFLSPQDVSALVREAASFYISEGNLSRAVSALEQGRMLVWSRMKGYRDPIPGLQSKDPMLVDRFEEIRRQLESVATFIDSHTQPALEPISSGRFEKAWSQFIMLSEEFNKLAREIGYPHFLRSDAGSDASDAAAEGPVIIVNISEYGSDAIIALPNNR
ncbi:hypothetical protein VKT23_007695 [Stygiomarasmius scandens]|uniref:TPR-like protein n=1 Tax=Marasmiellus scandens TaxID=2682957 RepID=A0ABR1JQ87_9AGAR